MKKIATLFLSLFFSILLFCQSPSSFKYQAVLRNIRGDIRANADATILIEITKNQGNGAVIYSETHKVKTDNFGLIDLEIGKGTPVIGNFAAISWGNGTYFVKISVDGVLMGTAQLHSVPYALYAEKAGNGFSGDYNDLINKPYIFDGTWQGLFGKPAFATVATTGQYNDLLGKPIMFDGTWSSLTGKPTLALVATSGNYNDLINKPVLTGTVTNVTSTSPVVVTNGSTTPAISIPKASATVNGYLSSADWTTFNNKSSFNGAWASLTGKPTTIIGYGINDFDFTGATANDLLRFDGIKWVNFSPTYLTIEVDGSVTNEIEMPSDATDGDLAYFNGTKWIRVPKGTVGQILTMSASNVPYWQNGSAFSNPIAPSATVLAATNVLLNSATLNGSVNANGFSTIVSLEYGLTTNYGDGGMTAEGSPVTGNIDKNVFADIYGLSANTEYHFRLKTSNAVGVSYSDDMSFTTSGSAPIVSTTASSGTTTTGTTLNGTINANGLSSTVTFEYGLTTAYGSNANASPVSGNSNTNVAINLSGLTIGTTFHYRVNATNSLGTTHGSDMTFTTLGAVPTAITTAITGITKTNGTINGIVNANFVSTTVSFEYGLTTGYGSVAASTPSTVTGSTNTNVSAIITGLATGTTYHYRVKATNSLGTTNGSDMTFTTAPSSITDNDGNTYNVVAIGAQVWMTENLKTTKYNDNSEIPLVSDPTAWSNIYNNALTTPAYCWYNNDITNKTLYGALYNWYAINSSTNANKNVCPIGWHVPTKDEWTTLTNYLINNGYGYGGNGNNITKSLAATSGWTTSALVGTAGNDQGSNNSSGFSALPSGYRVGSNSYYFSLEFGCYWWSSTEFLLSSSVWTMNLSYNHTSVSLSAGGFKHEGFSVRCLRD